jgi:membrane-bound lytic murein transglycosylase F
VRVGSDTLLSAINGFLFQRALTTHRRESYVGDLDVIKARRVVRVAMLNNGAAYFIYRGQEVGFQYEVAELLAKRLKARLEVVVPDGPADLTRMLVEGHADIAVFAPSRSDPLSSAVALSDPLMFAEHVLVQPASEPKITSIDELRGRTIYLRSTSSYYETLAQLPAVRSGHRRCRGQRRATSHGVQFGALGRGAEPPRRCASHLRVWQ